MSKECIQFFGPLCMQYVMLFHCNNGCTNAPQCYVIRTLPVFFVSVRECVLRAPVDVSSVVCILCWFYDWSFVVELER